MGQPQGTAPTNVPYVVDFEYDDIRPVTDVNVVREVCDLLGWSLVEEQPVHEYGAWNVVPDADFIREADFEGEAWKSVYLKDRRLVAVSMQM